jgi:hypothetical protein
MLMSVMMSGTYEERKITRREAGPGEKSQIQLECTEFDIYMAMVNRQLIGSKKKSELES